MTAPELWTRRGVILVPPERHAWWRSHAQTPTPLVLGPRHWRIYFAGRNSDNQSRMIFADVDPQDDMRVLGVQDTPLLELGKPGSFDTAGHGVSMLLPRDGALYLFYLGMHLRPDVPMGMGVGRAISHDDGASFTRLSEGPVLAYSTVDPYFCSLMHVASCEDGSLRAWYMSGNGWEPRPNAAPDPIYGLRQALSRDNGLTWQPEQVSLGLGEGLLPRSVALARPWVAEVNGSKRLWFSWRATENFRTELASAYRIMSVPLTAQETIGGPMTELRFANPPAPGDWDSFMQAYATFVPFESGYVMFYNGNGFGQSGFGWATLGL